VNCDGKPIKLYSLDVVGEIRGERCNLSISMPPNETRQKVKLFSAERDFALFSPFIAPLFCHCRSLGERDKSRHLPRSAPPLLGRARHGLCITARSCSPSSGCTTAFCTTRVAPIRVVLVLVAVCTSPHRPGAVTDNTLKKLRMRERAFQWTYPSDLLRLSLMGRVRLSRSRLRAPHRRYPDPWTDPKVPRVLSRVPERPPGHLLFLSRSCHTSSRLSGDGA
jgi:hypothetical protein